MINSEFRVSLPQILAVCIKNIILVGFGMTLGFPTVLIPALQQKTDEEQTDDFSLTKAQISWISSINLICVPFGCVVSGSITAYLGRKKAMQLVCLPLFSAWIIFYYAHEVFHLYIALSVSGFTGGMLEAPVLTYVAEISTPKLRGILAATGSFCIILGIFSEFLMGIFLQWRTITLISTSAPILALFFLFFVPESPHWLILKKRDEEAKKSLMWLRGWQKSFEPVKQEFDELHSNISTRENAAGSEGHENVWNSFGRRTFLLPYFICSLAFFIGHFSGMTTLQTYAVQIFAQLKAPVDKYFATMLLGIVELIGTAVCVILVRFVGKRKLTFFSTFGCSFCFFSTSIYAFFIDHIPGEIHKNNIIANVTNTIGSITNETTSRIVELMTTTDPMTTDQMTTEFSSELQASSISVNESTASVSGLHSNQHSWIPLSLLLASALISHCGIRLLPWMLVGEVYPAKIRGISSGLTGGTSYIFGFLANKMFLSMVASLTLPGTFLLYSCISVVGSIILYILLPETEGRTLQEIEDHFSGKKKIPKSLKRKDPVSEIAFPPFDVNKWESNEKFEKHLQQHKYGHVVLAANTQNNSNGLQKKNISNQKKSEVSDEDYDTPL